MENQFTDENKYITKSTHTSYSHKTLVGIDKNQRKYCGRYIRENNRNHYCPAKRDDRQIFRRQFTMIPIEKVVR